MWRPDDCSIRQLCEVRQKLFNNLAVERQRFLTVFSRSVSSFDPRVTNILTGEAFLYVGWMF